MLRIGPKTASKPVLPCTDAASDARDAAVGNRVVYCDMVTATVPPKTRPHSSAEREALLAVSTMTARWAWRSSKPSLPRIGRALECIGDAAVSAVVGEEQLFQRRLTADKVPHAGGRQCAEERFERAD